MNRRDILRLLFGGAAPVVAGCSLLGREEPEPTPTTPEPPTPAASELARLHQRALEHRYVPEFGPNYDFDYGQKRFDDIPSTAIDRIEARAADGTGDRIRFTPGALSADELRGWLRVIWPVPDERELEGQISGESVRFRGGRAEGYVYFLSIPATDSSPVWGIRAETVDDARRIADATD